MNLVIDIGNTHIHIAWFQGEDCVSEFRLTTRLDRTSDELAFWFKQSSKDSVTPDLVLVSSVVPDMTLLCEKALRALWNSKLVHVNYNLMQKLGLTIEIDSPKEVGADRMVNTYSAWQQQQKAAIIIDFGTATTFDVLSNKGAYCGGVIAPGINLSVKALHKAAAKLPNIDIAPTKSYLGKNTVHAMQSGIYFGYLGLIEHITEGLRKELAQDTIRVIATGGLAGLFAKGTGVIQEHQPNLTINGLRIIAEKYSEA